MVLGRVWRSFGEILKYWRGFGGVGNFEETREETRAVLVILKRRGRNFGDVGETGEVAGVLEVSA